MFWSEEKEAVLSVCTRDDLSTYTHILYLDVPVETIAQRRSNDTKRGRDPISVTNLCKWQEEEKTQLRDICRHYRILFSLISPHSEMLTRVSKLLHDFRYHTEEYNLSQAKVRLDEAVMAGQGQLESVLVMDADKTLAIEDTGTLFWDLVANSRQSKHKASTLTALFDSPLAYSYIAFRQAVLLYKETATEQEFDVLCQEVASAMTMYPEFGCLLRLVAEQNHVGAIVVTSRLRRVWDKVLEREGLSEKVKVIGGGRIADGIVVTAAVKGALVTRLREAKMDVWAFGDSPLDLDMLRNANQAVVVVGEEQTRSNTIDSSLAAAIQRDRFQAHQALLPSSASLRLDETRLPIIKLTTPEFVNSLLGGRYTHGGLQVLCTMEGTTAKLLATPMRDAGVAGPDLKGGAPPC